VTGDEVAGGVVAWARDVLPDLLAGYDYTVSMKDRLPDVVVDFTGVGVRRTDVDFPYVDLQQTLIVRHDLMLSFMVDNTDPEAAASQLRAFADALLLSILQDGTLGGRVPFVSPYVTFDYTPPFVQYADGTEGREMTMTLSVADPVEVSQ
jgi:hypothetical protein